MGAVACLVLLVAGFVVPIEAVPALPSLGSVEKEAERYTHPANILLSAPKSTSSYRSEPISRESRNQRYWSKQPKVEPQEWEEEVHHNGLPSIPKDWLSLGPPGEATNSHKAASPKPVEVKKEPPPLEVKKEPQHLVTPKLEVKPEPSSHDSAPVDPVPRPLPESFGLPSLASLDEVRESPKPTRHKAGYDKDRRMRVLAHVVHDWPYHKPLPGPSPLKFKMLEAMPEKRRKGILQGRQRRRTSHGPQVLSTEDSIEYLGELGGKMWKDKAYRYLSAFREYRDARPQTQTPPPSP